MASSHTVTSTFSSSRERENVPPRETKLPQDGFGSRRRILKNPLLTNAFKMAPNAVLGNTTADIRDMLRVGKKQVFKRSFSFISTLALTIILIHTFTGNITALTTTSREVFAVSRDRGFSFSQWLSKIEQKRYTPFNAVYATAFWSSVLCVINIGSTIASNVIISPTLLALLSTYMLSIGCVYPKRIRQERLPPTRWSLGRYGLAINVFASLYFAFAIIFSCFPVSLPVDTRTTNWAPAVWKSVLGMGVK